VAALRGGGAEPETDVLAAVADLSVFPEAAPSPAALEALYAERLSGLSVAEYDSSAPGGFCSSYVPMAEQAAGDVQVSSRADG
jgi:hypothetical protein